MAREPTVRDAVKRSSKRHEIVLDVSRLSDQQRQQLEVKLKDLAKGLAPDARLGSLVQSEGGHVSHRDSDGWF